MKIVEATNEQNAIDAYRYEFGIHDDGFMAFVYQRSGFGSLMSMHVEDYRIADTHPYDENTPDHVIEEEPILVFEGKPDYESRYREYYESGPKDLDSWSDNDLKKLMELYPFPDKMLVCMHRAWERDSCFQVHPVAKLREGIEEKEFDLPRGSTC